MALIKEMSVKAAACNYPSGTRMSVKEFQRKIGQAYEFLANLPQPNRVRMIVLEEVSSRKVAGYLILLLDYVNLTTGEKQAFVVEFGILPKYWRKGRPYQILLRKAESLARENGNHYLFGIVTPTNERCLKYAREEGFVIQRYEIVKPL